MSTQSSQHGVMVEYEPDTREVLLSDSMGGGTIFTTDFGEDDLVRGIAQYIKNNAYDLASEVVAELGTIEYPPSEDDDES